MKFDKEKMLSLAERHMRNGKFGAAADVYQKFIDVRPDDLAMINALGDLCARMGRCQEAARHYLRVADVYANDGFWVKAIAVYKKLHKLDPCDCAVGLKVGDLYAKQGLIVEARNWYSAIAEQCKKRGEIKTTIEALKKIAGTEPENLELKFNLAEFLHESGFGADAFEIYLNAGRNLLNQGRSREACGACLKALSVIPDSKQALGCLTYACLQDHELKDAVDRLKEACAKNPEDIDLLFLFCRAHLDLNEIDEAEAIFRRLFKIDGSRCEYLLQVARRFVEIGDSAHAAEIFDYCENGLSSRHQRAESISLLKSILDLDGGDIHVFRRLARLYLSDDEKEQAAAALKGAADAAFEKANVEEAVDALTELVKIAPKEEAYKRKLAELLGEPFLEEVPEEAPIEDPPESPAGPDEMNISGCEIDSLSILCEHEIDLSMEDVSSAPSASGESAEKNFDLKLKVSQESEACERRRFDKALVHEWRRAIRSGSPISLILIEVGCLNRSEFAAVVSAIEEELKRVGDLVETFSSEQAAVVLPGSSAEGSRTMAERIRLRMSAPDIAFVVANFHFGIATAIPQRGSSPAALIAAAKEALYQAKQTRHTHVIHADELMTA